MRIASLLPGATELLFALDLGDSLVGVSHDCDFPRAASELAKLTRTNVQTTLSSAAIDAQVQSRALAERPLYELDESRLAELKPELIVTQAHCDVCAVSLNQVRQLVTSHPSLCGTEVFALDPRSIDELLQDTRRLGRVTNRVDQAERFCDALAARIDRVRRQVMGAPRPRVACVEWIEPMMIAGNWVPELVDLAGGDPLMTCGGEPSQYREWSRLVDEKPDVVVIAPCGFDLARARQELERASELPLRELPSSSRVYLLDGNAYLNRMGPRLVESLEILAHFCHPTLLDRPHGGGFESLESE